ncbi:MAG: cellulase family glycosylhydrolase [Bifidobacteriaceae bacterium]|jgi:endo-1,4-beta-mannosidase|nr:cellulase family glycosylhydrolase [Bifidobacteriaceae bacterium]
MRDDYSDVRGFNYQMSTGSTSLENWLRYSPDRFELELRRGKEYFPAFNTLRLWLSWDAYFRRPGVFKERFESQLAIADRLGLKVVACLFNRWHDVTGYDNGGVYLDNFLLPAAWAHYVRLYGEFAADVVGEHADDDRVIIWDICNEPWPYNNFSQAVKALVKPELEWLVEMHAIVKGTGSAIPTGVSVHNYLGIEGLGWVEPLSDVLLIHPYYMCTSENIYDPARRARYEAHVMEYVEYARRVGKPILVTETCWGADTDEQRVEIMRFTLQTLAKHNLGFIPHALHYSLCADLHDEVDGFVGQCRNLAFTRRDGALRPGHEIFNNF